MEHLLKQGGLGGALLSIECSEGVSRETTFGQRCKGRGAGKPGRLEGQGPWRGPWLCPGQATAGF